MSENQNCEVRDFSIYDEISTKELEEILRLDAESAEDQESDTEKLLYVMEVLTKRRNSNSHTGKTAQEAYESFKEHYLPEIDSERKPKCISLHWIRPLAATAAILVIVIFGSVTAKAFGVDVWKAVVQWTQETFHFGAWGDSAPDDKLPYASLQEALEKGNTPSWLVPTWIPDGYDLTNISVEFSPLQKQYRAAYSKGVNILHITVQKHLNKNPVYVEQSEGLVEEEYVVSGITFYLIKNIDAVKAVWIYDSYECRINGNLTIDEVKIMIDSIEKG